jgi:uroporphyrin-III C-methyltransferase/precorrin-2 dehydrogenase/sirohydrochlorin ferrochelatase
VNVVDRTELSTFIMPAIVDRGDVVVAVGTSGAAPVLARRIRERIEALLPARIGELASLLGRWRPRVAGRFQDFSQKRRFWEKAVDGPIAEAVLTGRASEAEALLFDALTQPETDGLQAGSVAIVGAGPGDPDLLTLKALRAIQDADVVFYDDLVTAGILDRVRRDADRVFVGKRRGEPGIGQAEINRRVVEAAHAGKRVVRLKGGDPFVFGRGGEELEHLRAHGIDATVVPGITAALACGAAAGIPLTHRDHASAVTFVTGHLKNGEPAADWDALARSGQTIVVYMGLSAAGTVRDRLQDAGLARTTPVAIIENASRPGQKVSVGTLGGLTALAARHANGGPALMIIGQVAALADVATQSALAEAS